MDKKNFLISFLVSMLAFLLCCWTAAYSLYAAGWAESICYFVITYLLLNKFAKPGTYGTPYLLAIILGRMVFELPIRITEFGTTLFSLFIPIIVLVTIFLASLYFKEKRPAVLVLSVIILILLNTIAHEDWINCFGHH